MLYLQRSRQLAVAALAFDLNHTIVYPETRLAVPGAIDFLEAVSEQGLGIALVTDSTAFVVDELLKAVGLSRKKFALVHSSGAYSTEERKGKNSRTWADALRMLGVKPENILVVDNSPASVAVAKATGMLVAGITTTNSPDSLRAAGATLVSDHYSELAEELGILL